MADIKVGDVVRLKSGGLSMTVNDVRSETKPWFCWFTKISTDRYAHVVWFEILDTVHGLPEYGDFQGQIVNVDTLELVK